MKILIVSENFYPDTFAINNIVKELVERGHSVTVLTGLPDYTTSLIPDEYKHGKNRIQNYCGATVYRVPTIARHHGPIWRALNYLSFVVSGNIFARTHIFEEFDVIYVWEVSPVTMTIPAITLKHRYNKPLFLYCLDIWPECIKAMGFREKSIVFSIVKELSGWIYRQCDHIAVSSEPFFSYLESVNNCDRSKMSYLPQFASEDLLNMDLNKEPNGCFDFLYIGNIGKAQDMHCLIDAIAKMQNRLDVTFHIIGGGSAYLDTKVYAEKTGAAKIIKFYGPMPSAKAAQYYKTADACVLTLDGSSQIGDTLPGKLQTYMAAGKPIFGAINGAGNIVINESKSGKCVNSGDSEGLCGLLLDYINNTCDYDQCGSNARKYFLENYTIDLHFHKLMSILYYLTCNKD